MFKMGITWSIEFHLVQRKDAVLRLGHAVQAGSTGGLQEQCALSRRNCRAKARPEKARPENVRRGNRCERAQLKSRANHVDRQTVPPVFLPSDIGRYVLAFRDFLRCIAPEKCRKQNSAPERSGAA